MDNLILSKIVRNIGVITLNRPKHLHALNTQMCELMVAALLEWRDNPDIHAIWIQHAPGSRGFCAGGDIRMLAQSGQEDGVEAEIFFKIEYRLNHLLKIYPKPVISIMDGVTMGGGVGISVHGLVRIATENTLFAMPEAGIGLFPDVGGGWFLPRLPGQLGLWLALTGSRLKNADTIIAKVATHYFNTKRLPKLFDQMQDFFEGFGDASSMNIALQAFLDRHQDDAPKATLLTAPNLNAIDKHFSHDSAEKIVASLQADDGEFAQSMLKFLEKKSPLTIKVTIEQLKRGAQLKAFEDNMAMEFRLGSRIIKLPEFHEGVRAVVIDKDNHPNWTYPSIEAVDDLEVQSLFDELEPEKEWTPLENI